MVNVPMGLIPLARGAVESEGRVGRGQRGQVRSCGIGSPQPDAYGSHVRLFPSSCVAGRCPCAVGSCYLFPVHLLGVARGLPCAVRQPPSTIHQGAGAISCRADHVGQAGCDGRLLPLYWKALRQDGTPRHYDVGSTTLGTMRLMGHVSSMSFAMIVFSFYLGAVEITPLYYPPFLASVKVAFAVFSALCIRGIFASFARGKLW